MGTLSAIEKRRKALQEAAQSEGDRIEALKRAADREANTERNTEEKKTKKPKKCPAWIRPEDCKR